MQKNVKTDSELITSLAEDLKQSNTDPDNALIMLQNLEYLLHQVRLHRRSFLFLQVDNGAEFLKRNGLELLRRFIHSDNVDNQRAALTAMSAAIQG